MTINDQNKLLELQANGHAIKIDIGPYVDGFARIYRREDGKVVFDLLSQAGRLGGIPPTTKVGLGFLPLRIVIISMMLSIALAMR